MICVPRFYEHMEVCAVWGKRVWYKQLSERLEKMLKALVKMADLAKHVRYVLKLSSKVGADHHPAVSRVLAVTLTRCSTTTVLPIFVACLKVLSNLHTLQILHAHSQMMTPLKNAFEKVSLPQIKTIILPTCAHNVLRSCPNVAELTCNEHDGGKLVNALIKASIHGVEVIRGTSAGRYSTCVDVSSPASSPLMPIVELAQPAAKPTIRRGMTSNTTYDSIIDCVTGDAAIPTKAV